MKPSVKSALINLALLLSTLLIMFVIGEGIIRLLGRTDANGQFYVGDRKVQPLQLPLATVAESLDAYRNAPPETIRRPIDPDLGWKLQPNGVHADDDASYRHNAAGIRADVEYDLDPTPGTLRIALYGDSFTYGDQVSLEDTWGYQLEALLNEHNIDAEVINFGVGGYGMDQAFLRWQLQGHEYAPDIVIFGFQAENMYRNVNTFRPFANNASGGLFFKPRYVLDGDELTLLNSPVVAPDQILSTAEDFANSPLADHEYFFDRDDYRARWWSNSKLISYILTRLDTFLTPDDDFFAFNNEPAQLTRAIIEAFRTDVEARGAQFVIVHIPIQLYLEPYAASEPLVYHDVLAFLDDNYTVIRPEEAFLSPDSQLEDYFFPHLTPLGNRLVANAVFEEIRLMTTG